MEIKKFRFPEDQKWMAGRQVFMRPESRASILAMRDIVSSPEEHDALTRAHVRSTLARRAMSEADIQAEIDAANAFDEANPLL